MKLYSYGFNGRTQQARITVGIDADGNTLVWLPGATEQIRVTKGNPLRIEISGNGPGPDVAILTEAFFDR